MKKLTLAAALVFSLATANFAWAGANGWTPKLTIAQMFIIDTSDVGAVCQFSLSDGSMWGFKVAGHESTVGLIQTAMTNAKLVQVNNDQSGCSSCPSSFLDYTPVNSYGAKQHVPLSFGVNVNR